MSAPCGRMACGARHAGQVVRIPPLPRSSLHVCLQGSSIACVLVLSFATSRRLGKPRIADWALALEIKSFELSVMFPPVLRLEVPEPPPLAATGDDNDRGGDNIAGLPAHPQRAELLAAYPWLRYFRVMTAEPPPPLPVPFANPPPSYTLLPRHSARAGGGAAADGRTGARHGHRRRARDDGQGPRGGGGNWRRRHG